MADSRIPDPFEQAAAIASADVARWALWRSALAAAIERGYRHPDCDWMHTDTSVCGVCIGTAHAFIAARTVDKPQTLARDQAFRFAAWLRYGGAR